MKPTVISAETAVDAWKAGVGVLLDNVEVTNLITTVEDPTRFERAWLSDLSPHFVDDRYDNLRDVVNTIFPIGIAQRSATRADLFNRYLLTHDRATRWRGRKWGTYFERLVRFPPGGVNQLDRAIDKLRSWPRRCKTGLVFHLSSPEIDAPRTRGGPCWQFAEILWQSEDMIDLVVVYRNHDFMNKVLGNFIGLGQLLKFICEESGKEPGRLLCHSVHAFYSGTRNHLRELAQ
jgi:hypothetical protein